MARTVYYVARYSGGYMPRKGKRVMFLTRETAQHAADRIHGSVVSLTVTPPGREGERGRP